MDRGELQDVCREIRCCRNYGASAGARCVDLLTHSRKGSRLAFLEYSGSDYRSASVNNFPLSPKVKNQAKSRAVNGCAASKLLPRFGENVLLAGLGIIVISFVLHVLLVDYKTEASVVVSLIGLYGLGNGMVLPFLLNVVLDQVPVSDAGIASGIFSTFQQIASALGIGIIGGVFYQTLTGASADYKLALDNGLFVGLGFAIVVAGMLLVTQNSKSRPPRKRDNAALDMI